MKTRNSVLKNRIYKRKTTTPKEKTRKKKTNEIVPAQPAAAIGLEASWILVDVGAQVIENAPRVIERLTQRNVIW